MGAPREKDDDEGGVRLRMKEREREGKVEGETLRERGEGQREGWEQNDGSVEDNDDGK